MGSSAIMEDSCHRRRTTTTTTNHHNTTGTNYNTHSTHSNLLQVPSGEDNDDDDDPRRQKQHQSQSQQIRGRPSKQERRRKKRIHANHDDIPFWKIVLHVGMTLFLFCIVIHFLYRRIYPYDPNEGMVEEIVYIVDDDDTNADSKGEGIDKNNLVLSSPMATPPTGTTPNQPPSTTTTTVHYTEQDEAQLALLAKHRKHDSQSITTLTADEEEEEEASVIHPVIVPEEKEEITIPPLPEFVLSSHAMKWDVYGILDSTTTNHAGSTTGTTTTTRSPFWDVAHGLRERFAARYGSENAARMLLDVGLTTYSTVDETTSNTKQKDPSGTTTTTSRRHVTEASTTGVPSDVHSTACRFHSARREDRPFYLAFGGYSVTAGRGNLYQQSFPFQLERILQTAVKMVGITSGLKVVNAAIGGSPAFPYGWCMKNFWDVSPDVVSWDYSMNEAGSVPEGLEAYIRQIIATYPNNVPKLIVKDTYLAAPRRELVGKYLPWLHDPVVLHTGPAIKPFMERPDAHNPIGFQDWRKFGAPEGAPGQALHHPALKEHELMGWMLAMHFLTALEYLESYKDTDKEIQCPEATKGGVTDLPPPVTGHNISYYDRTLFGYPTGVEGSETWKMNPLHCRTTFQPILSGDLSELVVSGTTAEDVDVTLPKSQMYYNDGWTYDLSEEERNANIKLSLYENSLGFIDSKEAYYGIYESPMMQLLLPYLPTDDRELTTAAAAAGPQVGQLASSWFESVVICQVHEKRDATACNMGSDLEYVVGGVNVTSHQMLKDTGTLYLGKPICSKIPVPSTATLTSHNTLLASSSSSSSTINSQSTTSDPPQQEQQEPQSQSEEPQLLLEKDQVGLLMTIRVNNPHISRIHQACSVSHIVWEQKQ